MKVERAKMATDGDGLMGDRDKCPMPVSGFAQLRRANRCVTRLYNLVLSSCGLNATQYVLLQTIGDANEVSQHELANALSIASATLSRRLAGLKRKGLVKSRVDKRASRIYAITPSGKAIIRSADLQWRSAEQRLRRTLGESKWRLFLDVCEEVYAAAEEAEGLRMALDSNGHR